LQRLLSTSGRDTTLKQVSDILPNEPLARLIDEAIDAAQAGNEAGKIWLP
jgi:hypothetical protein